MLDSMIYLEERDFWFPRVVLGRRQSTERTGQSGCDFSSKTMFQALDDL